MSDRISGLPVASEAIAGNDLVAVTNVSQPGTGETQKFTQDQLTASQLKLNLRTATELTIATGAITITQGAHKLQPESGTTDVLSTISGMAAGEVAFLIVSDKGTDTITVEHGTDNISCVGEADIALSNGMIVCYSDGTTVYVSGGGGGGGSAPETTAANDFQVGDGAGAWIKKTLAETKTILGVKEVNTTFMLSAAGTTPADTNGCADAEKKTSTTNKITYKVCAFDKDTKEICWWNHPLPSDYNGGVVKYRVFWEHPATDTNFKVAWDLAAVAAGNDDAIDAALGDVVQVNGIGGTTNDLYRTDMSGDLTIAGTPAAGKMVYWRLRRVADDATNDTLAVDAWLAYVEITYTRA
jgi:hypothetical protein